MMKVELWVKEAAGACNRDLSLDVSIEHLSEQLKKYQTLVNTGRIHEASMNQIISQVDVIKPELSDADSAALKEDVSSLKEKFERVWQEVQTRLVNLEEAHRNRTKFESETRELARLVQSSQDELKQLTRGIGSKQEDAVSMLNKSQV